VAGPAAAPMDHTVTVMGSPGADLAPYRCGGSGPDWLFSPGTSRVAVALPLRASLSEQSEAAQAPRDVSRSPTSTPGAAPAVPVPRSSVPPSWAASSTRTRAAPIGQARALSTSSRPGSASSTDVGVGLKMTRGQMCQRPGPQVGVDPFDDGVPAVTLPGRSRHRRKPAGTASSPAAAAGRGISHPRRRERPTSPGKPVDHQRRRARRR